MLFAMHCQMLNSDEPIIGLLGKLEHLAACPQAKSHIRLIQSRMEVYTQTGHLSTQRPAWTSNKSINYNYLPWSIKIKGLHSFPSEGGSCREQRRSQVQRIVDATRLDLGDSGLETVLEESAACPPTFVPHS